MSYVNDDHDILGVVAIYNGKILICHGDQDSNIRKNAYWNWILCPPNIDKLQIPNLLYYLGFLGVVVQQ